MKQKARVVGLIAALISALIPALSLAHEGHGTWAAHAHEYEHFAWLLVGLVAAIALLIEGYRRYGAARIKGRENSKD